MGFVYAWIGHSGVQHPLFALGLSAGLPPMIWLGFRAFYRAKAAGDPQKQDGLPRSEPREAVKSDDSDTSSPPGINQRRR